jgi:hypothetical protein
MIKNLFNKLFNKKPKVDKREERKQAYKDAVDRLQTIVEEVKQKKKSINVGYIAPDEWEIDGVLYKVGDKVICRSNEPEPLLIGKIDYFWDNYGKWTNCIPHIKDNEGNVYGVMGIMKPYTDELLEEIKDLRPLEQWNYFVEDPWKYSEEEMLKKEEKYQNVQKAKGKNRNLAV